MHPRALTDSTLLLAALLVVPGAVPAAEAQVKARVGADGTLTIYNEPPPAPRAPAANPESPRAGTSRPRFAVLPPELEPLIERYSAQHGLDPRLVRAVIQAESGYNPRARSRRGAMGLMQLMPTTARVLAISDPYDPEQNVRGGTAYLRRLMDRFGRTELALAAYNAGPETVERYGGIPPYEETRTYVERVLGLYGQGDSARPPKRVRKLYLVRGPDRRPLLTTELP